MEKKVEQHLHDAAVQITPDAAAEERILKSVRTGKRSRKRLSGRVQAAVFCACALACLLWFGASGLMQDDIVVYAATEEHGWQKLKEGERILLKKEEHQHAGEEGGYSYRCDFRLEVPENYLYDKQMVVLRDDAIIEYGDRIEWHVAEDRAEDAGRIMKGVFRLWIVDEERERIGALELELTKENGKCYAELKRVWEKQGE